MISFMNNITYLMACVNTYRAYGGNAYLVKAVSLWETLQQSQISAADAARSQLGGINFSWLCSNSELRSGSLLLNA